MRIGFSGIQVGSCLIKLLIDFGRIDVGEPDPAQGGYVDGVTVYDVIDVPARVDLEGLSPHSQDGEEDRRRYEHADRPTSSHLRSLPGAHQGS
jgi:hypothetical protein